MKLWIYKFHIIAVNESVDDILGNRLIGLKCNHLLVFCQYLIRYA